MFVATLAFLLLHSVIGIDVVVENIKRIKATDPKPCDNFFRHACPYGAESLVEKHIVREIKDRVKSYHDEPWNQFEFINDFKNYDGLLYAGEMYDATQNLPVFTVMSLSQFISNRCNANQNMEQLFQHFQTLVTFNGNVTSHLGLQQFSDCSLESSLAIDRELKSFSKLFKEKYPGEYKDNQSILASPELTEFLKRAQKAIRERRVQMIGAEMIKNDEKFQKGVDIVLKMVQDMKDIAIDWIGKTEWVKRSSAVEKMQDYVRRTAVFLKYDWLIDETVSLFKEIDESYKTCKSDIVSNDVLGNVFCLLGAFVQNNLKEYEYKDRIPGTFGTGGANWGGDGSDYELHLDFYAFWAVTEIEEQAAIIGFVGSLLGHELGHTLDKNIGTRPFFSSIAAQCVAKLFENACKLFKEHSCSYSPSQDVEVTANVIGTRFAYQVFKNTLRDKSQEIYPKLNITYEQLFFHGLMVNSCTPNQSDQGPESSHPAVNIAQNVLSHIPAFKTAFKCAPDSPMVQVIDGECEIYGPGAPETRRFRN